MEHEPGSPEWWLHRLMQRLRNRQARYNLLHRYGTGDHRLPEGDERCRPVFQRFQRKARTNYTGLIAASVLERFRVVGFRAGGASTDEADKTAWKIWKENHLDADSGLVHEAAVSMSEAYVIVGPSLRGDDVPTITPEDPREVIVETHPANRRHILAGLKTWTDDVDQRAYATVYLPDAVHHFAAEPAEDTDAGRGWETEPRLPHSGWIPDPDMPVVANPFGEVPIVRFVNRPQLNGNGLGEYEDVIDIQDRINDTLLNRLVITKVQAYKQRWAKGITTEDEDGNPIDLPFVPGVDLLWAVESKDVEFGEFQDADIAPILKAIRDDITDLAAVSRTPAHYMLGEMVNVSGDALKAAETGLVSKVRERMRHFGEAWAHVMRLAYRYQGRDMDADAEVIWSDPESRSMGEMADAALKAKQFGVPWRQRMRDYGYSPAVIQRMESERSADALLASILTPEDVAQPEEPEQVA